MITSTHQQALEAEKALQDAVHEDIKIKAKLGQYVIVNRDGKPCKIKASEVLNKMDQKNN